MAAGILWRRLDALGNESALLLKSDRGWTLSGFAVFRHDHENCGLGYAITCDDGWRTQSAKVFGHIGTVQCDYDVHNNDGEWSVNGKEHPQAEGCTDIDIGFTPSTNLLPIRRLSLRVGESARIKIAWLRFPTMLLAASEQAYTRETDTRYRYESLESNFGCDLEVNSDGFVTNYPGFWIADDADSQSALR